MRVMIIQGTIMILLAVGALGRADGPAGPAAVAEAAPRLRLLFITPSAEARFFAPLKQGMRDAARMMDVDCAFTGTEGVDLPSQAAMVRRAVAEGYDGIALNLIEAGHIRWTVDQQPYIQGFYPVVQLTLYLRYGIVPSDIDAGATIIDRTSVREVTELTRRRYR